MALLQVRTINRYFKAGDNAVTSEQRGNALENLVRYLFERIPGVRLSEQAVIVANGSEELDLVFWNDRLPKGLPFLPNVLMFECKNWSDPVGSAAVGFYSLKAQQRHLEYAILVAASGVSGSGDELRAANQLIDTAFIGHKLHLIVITRTEIEQLRSTDMLVRLIQDKISKIVMRTKQF